MFAKEEGKYVDVLYAVNEYKTSMCSLQFFPSEFKRDGGDEYGGACHPNVSDPPP